MFLLIYIRFLKFTKYIIFWFSTRLPLRYLWNFQPTLLLRPPPFIWHSRVSNLINFYSPWNHQKTIGFPIIPGGNSFYISVKLTCCKWSTKNQQNGVFYPQAYLAPCQKCLWWSILKKIINPWKWPNTLKQFVGCCRRIVWVCLTALRGWILKG